MPLFLNSMPLSYGKQVIFLITIFSVFEAMLIVIALSMDAFASGFSYGASKIKIPFTSVMVISVVCSLVLAVSLALGSAVKAWMPGRLTVIICFFLLLLLGLANIFDSSLKAYIRKRSEFNKKLEFSVFSLKVILNIYADPETADRDCSRVLSPTEAAYLAMALSLDGLAAGFGAGITNTNIPLVILFSLASNVACVLLGCFLGNKIAQKVCLNLSWLSGALLIVLAVMKVF